MVARPAQGPPSRADGRANDETTALFVTTLDRLMSAEADARAIDASKTIPPSLLEALADLGTFGVSIPEAYGGSGLGLPGACAIVECLSRHDRSVATTVGLHLGLGTRPLADFGTHAQKQRWLPDLATGQQIAAFATTEPTSGSDLSRLRTTAHLQDSGALALDGQKIFVTNGGFADVYTLTTSSGTLGGVARGQSVVVVEASDPGVRRGAEEMKLGLRGSSTTTLFFDDVTLPMDRVLGEPGRGRDVLAHALAWGRIIMASGCLGAAQTALNATRRHTAEREQFGKPLDRLPVVRSQLADMAADVAAMGALVFWAANTPPGTPEFERRSLSAKIFCSETDWDVCDRALQLHGGAGFIEESGIPLLLRDARVTRIFEGANDVLATHLGMLEMLRPPSLHDDLSAASLPDDPGVAPIAAPGVAPIAAIVARAREALRDSFGVKVLGQPRCLHALGRMVVLREAARACSEPWRPMPDPVRERAQTSLTRRANALPSPATPDTTVDRIIL